MEAVIEDVKTKVCIKCHLEKAPKDYYVRRDNGKIRGQCKACDRLRDRIRYAKGKNESL